MKKLKFLLLSLFTPLFLGVSFGASPFFENYSDNLIYSSSVFKSTDQINLKEGYTYCFDIHNTDFPYNPWGSVELNSIFNNYGNCSTSTNVRLVGEYISYCFVAPCSMSNFTYCTSSYERNAQFPINIYEFSSSLDAPTNCSLTESQLTECKTNLNACVPNYNTCLYRVNTLNGQVGTLSGSLQSCQSDLATCTNSCDVSVSQCRESLSGCQSDLTNMTNYNDSLNSQLQECLANSPMPDIPCEGTGCDEIITGSNTMFSMFRSVEDMMYSLPLSNNIYLPRGYRGYVDSGVVAIGEIEKKKIVIDDDSFNEINKSYYKVFAGLIFLFLTALFTYYLKKFITKFFIPKS